MCQDNNQLLYFLFFMIHICTQAILRNVTSEAVNMKKNNQWK